MAVTPIALMADKTSAESKIYDFNFVNDLATGETITGLTSITANTPSGATALTITGPVFSSPKAQCRIAAGTAGYTYHITVTVTTSDGNTLQQCCDLRVVPC